MLGKKRYSLLWGLVLFLALVLRLWRLDLNPIGIVHDEMHQLINAKSLALTGKGAAGTVAGVFQNNPYCDGNCVFGELPSYLLIPFTWLSFTFPWVKLPFILISVLIVFFGGKLFENLSGNKLVGIIAGLMIAINPWSINFGRSAYENMFTFMFYLWSLYLFTKKPIKTKNQIWGIILGLAASLSYFGAKPVFVPLMLLGLVYGYLIERKKGKKYLVLGLSVIFIMGIYGIVLKNSYAGLRLKETELINNEVIHQVDEERRMSFEIPLVRDIFINKYTVLEKTLLRKYLTVLAPNYLFNEGEQGYDHFMIANHAFMYLADLPLIILGFYFLSQISIWAILFIGGIILTIPLTPMISNYASTYALRCGLLYPVLAGLAGLGAVCFIKNFKKSKTKIILSGLIIFIYLISFCNFEVMYWYRTPFQKSGGWVFYERQLVKYIGLLKESNSGSKIEIISTDPVDTIYAYAFFSGKINQKDFVEKMNQTIFGQEYMIDNIKVSKICPKNFEEDKIYLINQSVACVNEPNNLARISELRDGGAKWFIPKEILCKDYKLSAYPYPRKLEELKIENDNKENFCKKWINQP